MIKKHLVNLLLSFSLLAFFGCGENGEEHQNEKNRGQVSRNKEGL
jgi:hypothetical protein